MIKTDFKKYAEKLLAFALVFALMLSTWAPALSHPAFAAEDGVFSFNGNEYASFAEAVQTATESDSEYVGNKATPEKEIVLTLLKNADCGFDVGNSTGTKALNIKIDLGGHTLTLKPAVGSAGTVSNGIRVLAFSKLTVMNGTLTCPDAEEDNIKVGIANYGTLILDGVTVKSGALTQYTINNRGSLTLKGKTAVENGKAPQSDYGNKDNFIAITNDPYTYYYPTANNAVINCDSSSVTVGNVQLETYGTKGGNIELNISDGTFGEITKPQTENGTVEIRSNISGGKFTGGVTDYIDSDKYYVENNAVKAKQEQYFIFGNNMPSVWVGEGGYNCAITTTSSTAETVYEITEGSDLASVDSKTGEVTFKGGVGVVKVKASNEGDEKYLPAEKICTITITKRDYAVTLSDEIVNGNVELQFSDNLTFDTKATTTETKEEANFTYKVSNSELAEVDENGVVSIKKAGLIVVTVMRAETDLFNKLEKSYTLNVKTTEQSALEINVPDKVTYSTEPQKVITVKGGSGNGAITYEVIRGTDVATIDSNTGALTTLKAGTVTIRVTKESDGGYEAKSADVTIAIEKADQKDFGFEKSSPDALTWNEENKTFINPVINAKGEGALTYMITEGTDVADINADTGELTLKKAGTVKVTATKKGDDCYNDASASYTLVINKAKQSFTFTDGNAVNKYFGIIEYKNAAAGVTGNGELKYEIVGENKIGAAIDGEGKITFTDGEEQEGTVTVRATMKETEQYEAFSLEYTLTLSYIDVSSVKLSHIGETSGITGWYISDVKIKAPKGYKISYKNTLSDNEWSSALDYDKEGNNSFNVYLMDEYGHISAAIEDKLKIDKSSPADITVSFDSNPITKLINNLNYAIFNKTGEVKVTVKAKDTVSGVDKVIISYGETEKNLTVSTDWNGSYTATAKIPAQFRDSIKITVIDVAGNKTDYEDGKIYVIDTVAPGIEVKYQTDGNKNEHSDGILYFNSDVTAEFVIEEVNFDLADAPVVKIDGMTITLTWEKNETDGKWHASQILTAEGKHEIKATFTDASGNEMPEYTKTVCVDKTAPVITVTHNPSDKASYAQRTLTVTVTDANFDASKVSFAVIAKDAFGGDVSVGDYNTSVKWNGNVATLTFNTDAIYTFDVSCADKAGNTSSDFPEEAFTVDTTAPVKPVITYSDSVLEKVIGMLTFGFYKEKVQVTITTSDKTSGIGKISYTFINSDGTTETKEVTEGFSYKGEETYITFDIDAQFRGTLSAVAYDNAGISSEENADDKVIVADTENPAVTVTYESDVTPTFTDKDGKYVDSFVVADRAYYSGTVKAKIEVTEANFFEGESSQEGIINNLIILVTKTDKLGNVSVIQHLPTGAVKKDDADVSTEFTWTEASEGKYSYEIVLTDDADYVISLEYVDLSENKADVEASDMEGSAVKYSSKQITVDTKAPQVTVEYENDKVVEDVGGRKYFSQAQKAVITVVEHNFCSESFIASITASDVNGNSIEESYVNGLEELTWSSNGDTHTAEITFERNANYSFTYTVSDFAKNEAEKYNGDLFTVDTVKPSIDISYSKSTIDKVIDALTFGFYKTDVEVTVTASDATAGISYITWKYVKNGTSGKNANDSEELTVYADSTNTVDGVFTYKFKIKANARGYISATAFDRSGNNSLKKDSGKINVVDDISPVINVTYSAENTDTLLQYTKAGNTVDDFTLADTAYYNGKVNATITINEANFFEGIETDEGEIIHAVGIKLVKTDDEGKTTATEYLPEGAKKKFETEITVPITWKTEGDIHSVVIPYEADGDYKLYIDYSDFSENGADISGNDGIIVTTSYESKTVTVDKTAPEITVVAKNEDVKNTYGERDYFNNTQTLEITVKEHNFRASDFVATVTAKDGDGNAVSVVNFADYLSDKNSWKAVDGEKNTYRATVDFTADANYTFDYEFSDLAQNKSAEYTAAEFTVDVTPPAEPVITYSEHTDVISKVIEALTLGYYFYKEEVKVTITAADETSGVDVITWGFIKDKYAVAGKEDDINNSEKRTDGKTNDSINFTIPAEAKGYIEAVVTDRSGNTSEKKDEDKIIVADTLSPEIKVNYSFKDGTVVSLYDGDKEPVTEMTDASQIVFSDDVTAEITITEENFFEGDALSEGGVVHNVGIKLTKTDNDGKETVYEYLPFGAAGIYGTDNKVNFNWTTVGNEHSFAISYDDADGADYVLSIEYVDYSENEAKINSSYEKIDATASYTSKTVTVDKVTPVISVNYQNKNVIREIDGRKYFDGVQTAVITVEEHNFRAEDFIAEFEAVNVSGEAVETENYTEYLSSAKNWITQGNTHTATITFSNDANYTFDYMYSDMAGYYGEEYEKDVFTVDTTAPVFSEPAITYEEKVIEKIFSALTLGFFKAKAVVTVEVSDDTSGIYNIICNYIKQGNVSSVNKDNFEVPFEYKDITFSEDKKTATVSFEVEASARGHIEAVAFDRADNSSDKSDDKYIVVVDDKAPEIDITYVANDGTTKVQYVDEDLNTVGSFNEAAAAYFNGGVTAIIKINEANFFEGEELKDSSIINEVTVRVEKTDDKGNVTVYEYLPEALNMGEKDRVISWTKAEGTDEYTSSGIALTEDADYKLTVIYQDFSENEAVISGTDGVKNQNKTYSSKQITVDTTAPQVEITYDNNDVIQSLDGRDYFNKERTATVKVTEHNFRADDFDVIFTALDVTLKNNENTEDFVARLHDRTKWTSVGDVHTATIDFTEDANYTFDYTYEDLSYNECADYNEDVFAVDKKAPENINITYSDSLLQKLISLVSFRYYKEQVKVTISVQDMTTPVDEIVWTYNKQASSSDINTETYSKTVGREDITYSDDNKTATISFFIDAQMRGHISAVISDRSKNSSSVSKDSEMLVADTVSPTRTVEYTPERVMDAKTLLDVEVFGEGDDVILYYTSSAKVTFRINEANFYSEDVVIKVNGKEVKPTDWTQNGDEWTGSIVIAEEGDFIVTASYTDRSTNKMVDYTSQKIAIDSTAPVIDVKYDNNDALNENNYKADRKATITVTEHNFRADDIKVTVTAADIEGKEIEIPDYSAYLSDRSSWKTVGDVHTAEILYSADARYTFHIEYADLIGNKAEDFTKESFIVDHKAPADVEISYSSAVLDKVIEALSFGFYKAPVTVTLSADDITSGVDYFVYNFTKQAGTGDINKESEEVKVTTDKISYKNNGRYASYSFTIPAEARGYISVTATDKAGNTNGKSDSNKILVVDSISPEIEITYTPDSENTLVQFVDSAKKTVEDFASSVNAFYNGNVTATIVVTEENFMEGKNSEDGIIHKLGIKLTRTDDEGNVTVTEYKPASSKALYEGAQQEAIEWTTTGDRHEASINYALDGDYVLEVEYVDYSSNSAEISSNDGNKTAKSYKSKTVTVDKTAPEISVSYSNTDVKNEIGGRKYFDAVQTATIKVKEHNFRAADFAAAVTALDVTGANIAVEDFRATLSSDSAWTKENNVYTAVIKYTVDANYTFGYTYSDLALNKAEDYNGDVFTVDKTAPENLTVSYSTSVLDRILESITFGYYNAQMTVTVTADDITSGVLRFAYSYIKSDGVSEVNAELIKEIVEEASGNISYEGKTATMSFTIPKLLLKNDNQFNGTVSFTAFDRAENNTDMDDSRRVVVDSIKPTATITYNAPVQTANSISYYAGDINAKIVINEANFYSEDVTVTVTKDGANYPVSVQWTDDSVDIHTGVFTLSEDGDYIVKIEYKDRSDNEMDTYESNRLTLDTKLPSVHVSNIKNNSANKDEVYSFTLTANDINIDASSFTPVLRATVRNEDGSYETKTLSLGSMNTVKAGETYSFTVNNLEEDAVYTLSCVVRDMSGNTYNSVALDDGSTLSEVYFSINRDGSTFHTDKSTEKVLSDYYVKEVAEDIVIEEINVDPIESYRLTLNGKELTEGTDFTVERTSNSGEWSKISYIVNKELFTEEGEYSIVVESVDKTQTVVFSDVKELSVRFVVDKTAPVLTISGLESEGRYQVTEQTVTLIPTDDGGRLYSLKITVLDSKGQPLMSEADEDISVRFDMEGEEFLSYLDENDGVVTFTVPQGLENQVHIVCTDCAVGADGNTNHYDETFTKVTVSESGLIIYYANKPLFYGSIAGVVLTTGLIVFLIIYKKRKSDK